MMPDAIRIFPDQWLAKIGEERSSELRPFTAAALDTLT